MGRRGGVVSESDARPDGDGREFESRRSAVLKTYLGRAENVLANHYIGQASKFVKIHGSKLLLLSLRAGSKTIFVVALF